MPNEGRQILLRAYDEKALERFDHRLPALGYANRNEWFNAEVARIAGAAKKKAAAPKKAAKKAKPARTPAARKAKAKRTKKAAEPAPRAQTDGSA